MSSGHTCLCARYQLALALLVAELLPGLTSAMEAYDPVFDDVDRAFLQRVGVKVSVCLAPLTALWSILIPLHA